ncbi:Gryzun, putative trafficking through golgi-domain-containing protein [Clohesyomyces aquaticus]|uniref:Gryzun, putative trafficking through golgi-domain-containing protein n=1 Tax=Clohesyomyces aquaticus TaxID=1231657 RepID=A0A1Y1ZTA1_9PLEO|nr:Gryzun, putative trafficking through golgi-domain-containing protein [Clohesyomyces aquaticus]
MDAYPPEYVLHNLPFIVLSGLEASPELDHGLPDINHVLPGRAKTTIDSEIPPATGKRAQQLLSEFLNADGSDAPWNGRATTRRGNLIAFRLRAVGRHFQLPPRKADPPTNSGISPPGSPTIAPTTSWNLHSPISPLTPSASVFPDGVLAPSWVAKHQHYVPSVFISFFTFASDPNTNSLHDNQLKTEINKIKGQIQKSEYRTKYVVVLLSDKTILEAPDIEERLSTIRRATGLDPKNSLFFLPPNTSQVELRSFVVTVLSTLQPACIEYYRDLTKHARRKKGRGHVPPPTAPPTRGTSQTLSHPGWGVRYDFKLGVFAEFRQEMDAAQRHYNIALDGLFGPEGIFETTASWSPRWDEIRLLSDAIALRHLRCQLWNNYPTSAVKSWLTYKARLRDLLDRRGKGTANYGWEAWESRWAKIMAQLIQRAELPIFNISQPISDADPLVEGINALFAPPEKHFNVTDKIAPWELLHHPGYWYKLSTNHAKSRLILAREIPEEDRTPPGMSPATKVSNRNQMYDHYLVPEPHLEIPMKGTSGGFEHWKDIVDKLQAAIIEFDTREQSRKVEHLQLELSRTLLHVKRYDDGFKVLRPLWESMSWRAEGWWPLASEVLWALHECALRIQDPETYLATEWELYARVFSAKSRYRHDLMACLDNFPGDDSHVKSSVSINSRDFVSCLSVSFAFSEGEGNVGEPLPTQIVVTSAARPGSAPVRLSTLTFQFKGCLSEIQLTHQPNESSSDGASDLLQCDLEESSSTKGEQKSRWVGTSDLTIHAGQTKVYSFPIIFREAGDIDAIASVFEINTGRFDLVCSHTELEKIGLPMWWLKAGPKLKSRKLNRDSAVTVKILPKPPKMEIRLPNLLDHYYTDEPVSLSIEILNKEEEETEAVVEVRLLGRSKDILKYSWVGGAAPEPEAADSPSEGDETAEFDLPGHVLGRLVEGASRTEAIQFTAPTEPSDYALEVKVLYHLLSDRDIPISKTVIADLVFNGPFEASYDFTPRVHPDPWPSYFALQDAEANDSTPGGAFGIAQKWHLLAKLASFAEDCVVIRDMDIETHAIHGGATLLATKEFEPMETKMGFQDMCERGFCLDTRKVELEERRATSLDLSLVVAWQRASTTPKSSSEDEDEEEEEDATANPNPIVTTTLPIPRIHIPSSEPRVLASVLRPSPQSPDDDSSSALSSLIHIDYILENPTMHFLTFELSMEASEDFGFSGPKLRSLHLLPMSRQTVRYSVLPLLPPPVVVGVDEGDKGGRWIAPVLRVVDRYFNKTLKVVVVEGEGVRSDKRGVAVWVPREE